MCSKLNVLSVLLLRLTAMSSSKKGSFISSRVVDERAGERRAGWFGADGDVTERECSPGRTGAALIGSGAEENELNAAGVMTPGSLPGDNFRSGKPD